MEAVVGSSRMYTVRPGGFARELRGELMALGLAAGKRGAILAKPHVAEATVFQGQAVYRNLGDIAEEAGGSSTVISRDIGDVFAFVGTSRVSRL